MLLACFPSLENLSLSSLTPDSTNKSVRIQMTVVVKLQTAILGDDGGVTMETVSNGEYPHYIFLNWSLMATAGQD